MLTQPGENGVATELQRIEQEFITQRASLMEVEARLDDWQTAWEQRQRSIDASLAQLKSRLANPSERLKVSLLKIFPRPEGQS